LVEDDARKRQSRKTPPAETLFMVGRSVGVSGVGYALLGH
jgi:hypothetical protein